MRKFRLLLAVVILATLSFTNVHARAVGDRFVVDGTTYQILTISPQLTVEIRDTETKGDVSFPRTVADYPNTVYNVTP